MVAIIIGNSAAPLGKRRRRVQDALHQLYEWCFYVRGHTHLIRSVTIVLHHSFKEHILTSEGPVFEFTNQGWGNFDIDVTITWKTGSELHRIWPLVLESPDTSQEIEVPDEQSAHFEDIRRAELAAQCEAPPPNVRVNAKKWDECASAGYSLIGRVLEVTYPSEGGHEGGTWLARIVGFIENNGHHFLDSAGLSVVAEGVPFTDIIDVSSLVAKGQAKFVDPPGTEDFYWLNDKRLRLSARPDAEISIGPMTSISEESKDGVRQVLLDVFASAHNSCEAIQRMFARPLKDSHQLVCVWAEEAVEVIDGSPNRILAGMVFEVSLKRSAVARSFGFIHYIASTVPGFGSQLVERTCVYLSALGISILYSAADITMIGAVAAHYRWGFNFVTRREWINMKCLRYNDETIVAFMRLSIPPETKDGKANCIRVR